jgi:molybdopterin-containing oxidoreductase family iron-sulfur binding subunit
MKKDPYAPLRDQMDKAPSFWRSLEHKTGDESVTKTIDLEFPNGAAPSGYNRRDALKIAGASIAFGAMASCGDELHYSWRRPKEEILPFVHPPEKMIPGNRLQYATTMPRSEGAVGLLVEAHEGRPTKLEGNPNHPSSLGGSDTWAQAEVLRLYDPERARTPKNAGQASTWEKYDAFAKPQFARLLEGKGKGLALLLEENDGPTTARLVKELLAKAPEAKVYRWDSLTPDAALQGAQLAFGNGARTHLDLEKAKVIFALESDFLVLGPDHLALARQFGTSRAVHDKEDLEKMKRLYAAEAAWSTTGTNADHRLRIGSGQMIDVLKALGKALVANGVDVGAVASALEGGNALPEAGTKFVAALAKDLAAHKGTSLIVVGDRQPAAVHALGNALNVALGNLGQTLLVTQGEAVARTSVYDSLTALAKSLQAGEVDTLVIVEANPLYTAPGALKFGEAMAKAKTVIHAGHFAEETGEKATWHLPLAHFLESWADGRAFDGTASLTQPIILPLFDGRAANSVLAQVAGLEETGDRALLEATWRAKGAALEGNTEWRKALHDGVIAGTAWAKATPALKGADVAAAVAPLKGTVPSKDSLEFIAALGHPKDGRLSNVSWVMELPDTMSKLVWDNAVLVSPSTAKELGITSGVNKNKYLADLVELTVEGRKITAPTFVLPGVANNTLVMVQGYGRGTGEVAKGIGVDVNPLLSAGPVVQGVKLNRTGAQSDLCSTQDHFSVPGNPFKELTFAQMTAEPAGAKERKLGLGTRPLFRSGTAAEYAKDGEKLAHTGDMPEELLVEGTEKNRPSMPIQPVDNLVYDSQQWGMVIDLSACIGCNFCTIACVAENNIMAVGREQVMLGREMHWIRIDRYFNGDVEQPLAVHQPVACMHCENAPCEPVCPVGATVHDEEGINSMAYNRCIGTRYCANNCPFKVRRFNYLDFTHSGDIYVEPHVKDRMKTLKYQRNPDVTVRYRGVMEKCSYCTQRVEEAKVAQKRAGHDRKALPDGAVTPACAQACPTSAITFGNINDKDSRVAKLKMSERNYEMLQELNIRPRTTYLARVRNENEELG